MIFEGMSGLKLSLGVSCGYISGVEKFQLALNCMVD
jgi:hypothetical protein